MIPPTSWYELVECPKCKSDEEALVTFPIGHPWPTYVHTMDSKGQQLVELRDIGYITRSEMETFLRVW